ncbi:MAG TPA: LysR substrate-binding domain-containing protein [Streptosporangiaceae bacterium]|jgi:DNA-binding transcriptional LysR family regulator|nr:LysR substrate-binding domain-containing protein [Streptosporangiaceae bacterium]
MKRPPHSSSACPAQRNGSSLPGASAAPPVALALSTTAAVLAGAGPAMLSELAVSEDLASRRLTRVPVADLDLHRALLAIWTGGAVKPSGAARHLLAHVSRPRG